MVPTVEQVNLKRSRIASDNLLVLFRDEDIDVGITQEPWVMGLNATDYDTQYMNSTGGPRSCIIKKTH